MRKTLAFLLMVALVVTLAIPVLAGGSPPGKGPKGSPGKGPKVKGKISVEGAITAISSSASTFTMQVLTPGHQRQVGASTAVVWVQGATELKVTVKGSGNEFTRPASISDLHVGDRVQVEAFRLDDGRFLALKIHVKNRAIIGQPPTPPEGALAQGIVIAKGTNSLTVLAADGAKTVLVTSTTEIRGQRTSFGAVQITDSVVVRGTLNADGTITARSIEVTAAGAQITGTITLKSTVGPKFLVLNNSLAISVSDDTVIVSGGQRRSYADLGVGQTITVSGTPIIVAGVTIGYNAKVVSF